MIAPAPNTIRNALARLVVRCADESNTKRRSHLRPSRVRPRSGPASKGWVGAAALLDINFQVLQRVVRGLPVRASTVERVRLALVTTGAMSPRDILR